MTFKFQGFFRQILLLNIFLAYLAEQKTFAQTPDTTKAPSHTLYTAGIRAGINAAVVSNLAYSDVYLGWHTGVFGSIQARESVGVGGEINFSKQGVSVSGVDIALNYLNVPLYLNLYSGPVIFQGGIYGAFLAGAKATNDEVKTKVTGFFQDTDYGFIIGATLSPATRTFVGARFYLGMQNVNNHFAEPETAILLNRNIQLSAGYRF
jgi:hypothetical protein